MSKLIFMYSSRVFEENVLFTLTCIIGRALLYGATCTPTKFDELRNHLPNMGKVVIKKISEG